MMEFNSRNIRIWSKLGPHRVFGVTMLSLAEDIENLVVITADMKAFAGLDRFCKKYPEKFFNIGIAEQHMIGVAAGMVSEGFRVFTSAYAPFVTIRVLDQIRVNMGCMKLPIKLVGMAAGLSLGMLGATHVTSGDIAAIRAIPNITILSPADTTETAKALCAAAEMDSPVYLRLTGMDDTKIIYPQDYNFQIGKAIRLHSGKDVSIFATGTMVSAALETAEILAREKISASVTDVHTLKPMDRSSILESLDCDLIVTMEEHSVIGGLGAAVAEVLAPVRSKPRQLMIGMSDEYMHAGDYKYLLEQYGLTPQQCADKILKSLRAV